jgi:hypothetical protein
MWQSAVDRIVYDQLGMAHGEKFADALNFFIYDSVKIVFFTCNDYFSHHLFALVYECTKSTGVSE